ncbi:aminotransferase class I/II-fold pyridoxal phosphate-dependent enzyme [Kangiella marina]|uniref:histidinol-phosphate transaminase n=1 Tax=Kangiella marina TaxID=1079178 RepID=A0ABP8IQ16_9GAMM
MKPMYQNNLDLDAAGGSSVKPLKLDFNERSDSRPLWLAELGISTDCLWQYPDKSGLQQQAADFYQLDPEQVMLTNGGDESIELLFKLACLRQKKLILPLPAFSQYIVGKDNWGSDIDLIEPLEDMRIDLQSALAALASNSILILTSPNNPTGELIPYDDLVSACKKANAVGASVFLDEAYIEFAGDDSQSLGLISQFDNVVILRTLSKAFGLAGIRCGYLLGQQVMIRQFQQLAMPFNLPSPTIEIAKQAFTESAKLEVSNYAQVIAQNREQISELLISSGLDLVDSSANFVFVQGSSAKLRLIKAACQKRNITIKTQLSGLSAARDDIEAIRITIPFYIKSLLTALRLALQPELICFDMDGVLIDTRKSYDAAITSTVRRFTDTSIAQTDIERLRSQGGFNNDWVLTQALIRELGKDIDLESVTETFQDFYQGTEEKKGFKTLEKPLINNDLLKTLFITRSRTLKTAIVTGRPKDEAVEGSQFIGARNTLVISDNDVEQSKPNPEGVLKAKQFYGKELCWMLGDTPDDMAAANGAGAMAIGIGHDSLYQYGADLVLESVNQLEELL